MPEEELDPGRSTGPGTEPAGADRRPAGSGARVDWRAALRPSRSQLIVALAVCLLAAAVGIQVRATRTTAGYSSMSRADLVTILDGLNAESQRLQEEVDSLERTRDQLTSGVENDKLAQEQAQQRLDALGIMNGTLAARGRGVRIVIDAPAGALRADVLLDAIQELRDSGAEAMEVNDSIRLVARSWVGEDAAGLLIDGQQVSVPLTIDAIGDPHSLEEGARFRGGLVSQIEADSVGGSVTITQALDIRVESTRALASTEFTRPA